MMYMIKSIGALALIIALANGESNLKIKDIISKKPSNAPITKKPTKAPLSKKPTSKPIGKPSLQPTFSPTVKTHAYTITLTKQMLYVNGAFKPVVLVNGQTPGQSFSLHKSKFFSIHCFVLINRS